MTCERCRLPSRSAYCAICFKAESRGRSRRAGRPAPLVSWVSYLKARAA